MTMPVRIIRILARVFTLSLSLKRSLLGLICAVWACGPPNRNFVKINGPSQLFNTFVNPAPPTLSILLPETQLGDARLKCVDGLQVMYQRDAFEQSATSELHIFAIEPSSALNIGSPFQFAQLGAQPRVIPNDPRVIPKIVVVPFPKTSDPTQPTTLALASSAFWGPQGASLDLTLSGCYPVSSPQTWQPKGRIGAIAVFQHGACARVTPVDEVLSQVTSQLFLNFRQSVDNAKQNYIAAMSFVVRPGLLDPQAPQFNANDPNARGGFALDFSFSGDHASSTNEVSALYHYFYGLRGGVLVIDDFVSRGINQSGVFGWAFANNMQTALERTLPQTFFLSAQSKQMRALPGANPTCSATSDCAIAASLLGATITSQTLAQAGATTPTARDVNRMRCAVGVDTACQGLGLPSPFNDRWACAPPGPAQPPVCQYVVPIKRLNAFEDELETVFFDGPEFDNGAFGLVVAGGVPARQQLCSATWPPTCTTSPRGGALAQQQLCPGLPVGAPFTREFTLVAAGPR
jgi:hypothetical protein